MKFDILPKARLVSDEEKFRKNFRFHLWQNTGIWLLIIFFIIFFTAITGFSYAFMFLFGSFMVLTGVFLLKHKIISGIVLVLFGGFIVYVFFMLKYGSPEPIILTKLMRIITIIIAVKELVIPFLLRSMSVKREQRCTEEVQVNLTDGSRYVGKTEKLSTTRTFDLNTFPGAKAELYNQKKTSGYEYIYHYCGETYHMKMNIFMKEKLYEKCGSQFKVNIDPEAPEYYYNYRNMPVEELSKVIARMAIFGVIVLLLVWKFWLNS